MTVARRTFALTPGDLANLANATDWDDNGPVVPRIPAPRPPSDRLDCAGCGDDYPRHEITEYAGWPLCGDCHLDTAQRLDRDFTRYLATVTA